MKRRNLMVFLALILASALLIPWGRASAAPVQVNQPVRVGLFYGSSALPGANLLNDEGYGYRLGYFDGDGAFIQLGTTEQTAISVVKTQNVYYGKVGSWSGYYDSITSSIPVGCYHLQLPGSYPDFYSAQAAASAIPGGFPAWIDGEYYVRVGAYLDSDAAYGAQAALGLAGAALAGTSSGGVSVVQTGTSNILFQFDSTGGLYLGIQPGLDGSTKAKTIFRGNTYFGGFQYQRAGGNLTVVNVVPLEDYVQGVIIHEMSPSWPLEALKAQAVCARTYAARQIGKHRSQGFDVCNTIDCQVYSGIATMSGTSRQAVEETYGLYAFYNGSLAETVYFSSDGGATESAVNVWGSNVPYLIGKIDPYEADVAGKIGQYNWMVTYTRQQLTDLLNSKGYSNSGIVDIQLVTTATGNVKEITFIDANGRRFSKSGESARTFLGLRSQRYTVSGGSGGGSSAAGGSYYVDGDGVLSSMDGVYAIDGRGSVAQLPGGMPYVITSQGVAQLAPSAPAGIPGSPASGGDFVLTGSGYGHNVGLSQWGAYAMAQAGYSYYDILNFYYTGIEVRQP